jgi:hypothetical protein
MSCTDAVSGCEGVDDGDEGFSCVLAPGATRYDFGARLDLYRSTPEQFVPLYETELQEMQDFVPEYEADMEATQPDEEEQNEVRRMEHCKCRCRGECCDCTDCHHLPDTERGWYRCPACSWQDMRNEVIEWWESDLI